MSKSALAILMIMTMAGIALGSSSSHVGSSCMTNGSCNTGCICPSEANCTQSCNCLNTSSGSCSCTGAACTPLSTACTNNSCSLAGVNSEDSKQSDASGAGAGKKPPSLGRCPFQDL